MRTWEGLGVLWVSLFVEPGTVRNPVSIYCFYLKGDPGASHLGGREQQGCAEERGREGPARRAVEAAGQGTYAQVPGSELK